VRYKYLQIKQLRVLVDTVKHKASEYELRLLGAVLGPEALQQHGYWRLCFYSSFYTNLILPATLWLCGRLEMSTRNLPVDKRRPARKADNFTAICEPIV
jgi:hypothetical protein